MQVLLTIGLGVTTVYMTVFTWLAFKNMFERPQYEEDDDEF